MEEGKEIKTFHSGSTISSFSRNMIEKLNWIHLKAGLKEFSFTVSLSIRFLLKLMVLVTERLNLGKKSQHCYRFLMFALALSELQFSYYRKAFFLLFHIF